MQRAHDEGKWRPLTLHAFARALQVNIALEQVQQFLSEGCEETDLDAEQSVVSQLLQLRGLGKLLQLRGLGINRTRVT